MYPITRAVSIAVMPRAEKVIDLWLPGLVLTAEAYGITTRKRVLMWLANLAHESAELTRLEEDLRYTNPARLLQIFPRHFDDIDHAARYVRMGQEAIAARVYANRLGNGPEESGDGWTYRARGPNGLTFKTNYMSFSLAMFGDSQTLLDHPEYLIDPEIGAASAGWYWDLTKCSAAADGGDFDGVCDLINIGRKTIAMGDSNGFADRQHYLELAERTAPA